MNEAKAESSDERERGMLKGKKKEKKKKKVKTNNFYATLWNFHLLLLLFHFDYHRILLSRISKFRLLIRRLLLINARCVVCALLNGREHAVTATAAAAARTQSSC